MKIETHAAENLGKALAGRVASDLRNALEQRGRGSLAVPGGTTPAPFLKSLGSMDLDWSRVVVAPTDERCVALDHARSNHRLISETLLAGQAEAARLVSLYDPSRSVAAISATLDEHVLPLDVCVLGMGSDMHTASLFPGADALAQALDPSGTQPAMQIIAPGADEPRITLTVPALTSAAHAYLLIKSADKRLALEKALETDDPLDAPIKTILDAVSGLTVFYAD